MEKIASFNLDLNGKPLTIEFNNLAERANASLFLRYGDTAIMANCVMSNKDTSLDYFPLTVLYEEKYYAVGKILGSRFMKREGRPSEQSILTSRLIDRAIRPLFPFGFKKDIQIIITCLSWDQESDPAVLGLLAASTLLLCSDIPWNGPVAPLRLGEKNNEIIVFPTAEEREAGSMDLIISTLKSESGKEMLVNMVEAGLKEIKEDLFIKALEETQKLQRDLIDFQEDIRKKVGKEKITLTEVIKDEEFEKDILGFLDGKISKAMFGEKSTMPELREELNEYCQKFENAEKTKQAFEIFEMESEKILHSQGIKNKIRIDNRGLTSLRDITCEVGLFKRPHGSGLFCRGQTKVMSFLTLGAPGDQKIYEEMELQGKKRFMHHYNFPPYCVGETGPMRGPGRREIGHGMLAEKALKPVIPTAEQFPYTIRVVSEVLCSNGSSSMASTCASCLALMDGGVPIKAPVSGIAMGLLLEMDNTKSTEDKAFAVLTDVQGEEDHYGDMDFKATGTAEGLTAIQMDIKVRGITLNIIKETLVQSKIARMEILEKMLAVIAEPRGQLSQYAPKIYIIKINPEKIGDVIGTGGKIINEIIAECNVSIDIEDTGEVFVTGIDEASTKKAIEWIQNLTREVAVGEIFQGTVKRIMDFGAFVEVLPGQEGLVHISQLDNKRVEKVTDVVKLGDVIPVKVVSIDEQGRINLSLKEAKK
jgi:polyribonucleotide nucleotidyltransferase